MLLLLLLALAGFVIGILTLLCVAAADSIEGQDHRPATVWPILTFGASLLVLCIVIIGLAVGLSLNGHDPDEISVFAIVVALLLFGPLGVLVVLLGLSLRDRDTATSTWHPRALRTVITIFGYLLCCGAPAVLFPPLAGLTIAALFAGLAYVRQSRHAHLLWLLTISVEREFPLSTELAATGEAIGGRTGARLLGIADLLEDGLPFSRAIANRDSLVPQPAVLAARVGEQTGTLAQTLREAAIRATGTPGQGTHAAYLTGIVTYFWIVAFLFTGIVGFCMYYIVPKFKAIFEDFDVELPAVSVLLIEVSDLFVHWWFLGVPLVLTVLALSIVAGECYRRGWQNLSLPWLTQWFPRLDTPDILRNLARAVSSNTPLPDVLETLADHHHRPHIAERLAIVTNQTEQGQDPWDALAAVRLLKQTEVNLLQSAAAAGNLPWALNDVADRIDRKRSHRIQWWFEVIRPWPILILALAAATFALGMFLPLVKLLNELS